MKKWKLKRTSQCQKCPWIVGVNPHDIPNEYSEEKHRNLEATICTEANLKDLEKGEIKIMACHEKHDTHCIGWLNNQIGIGNNIPMRMKMFFCDNADKIRLRGEQHQNFNDTLPKKD